MLIDDLCTQNLIKDSKMLTPAEREEAYAWIEVHCTFGIGIVPASVIDSDGILTATERAMQLAVKDIERHVKPEFLLVDGRDKFWFDYPHTSIIRGDQTEPCISAASIVAKVTRDRLMIDLDKKFPQFGFASHKGYGTLEHQEAIRVHGPSPLHRRTYLH
jgi:ribonuclease HII